MRGVGVTMRVALATALAVVAAVARAGERPGTVYGSTTTMFLEYQVLDPDDPSAARYQMPVLEYVTLGSDDVGVRGMSVHLSGFGVGNIRNPVEGERLSGDILVGTVTYRSPSRAFLGRAGRQVLCETGTTLLMDGLYVRVEPLVGLDVSAWGGFVPYPRFSYDARRVVYGGRVGWGWFDIGRVGVAFMEERDDLGGDAERAFSNLAVDLALRRWRWLDLSGWLVADMTWGGLSEARVVATTSPHRWVRLSVDYGLSDPSARVPRTSIFSVFTRSFYHAAGADVALRTDGWLSGNAYFRYFAFHGADDGYQVGLRPVLSFGGRWRGTVGAEASRLAARSNAYFEARAFATWAPFAGADVSLDVDNYFYDEPMNGFDRSHVVRLIGGYEVFRGGRVQGDLAVSVNPDFRHMVSGLVKFSYAFSELVR